jgi:hypothetical protein
MLSLPHWFPSLSQHFLVSTAAVLIYVVSARALLRHHQTGIARQHVEVGEGGRARAG